MTRFTRILIVATVVALLPRVAVAGPLEDTAPKSPELASYQALRDLKLSGEVAHVAGLVLKRDAGVFTLKTGELHFVNAVDGRVTAAIFVGDGEFSLTPPIACEKQAIAIYTKSPGITESFGELVMRFSDQTYAEVKASPQASMSTGGASALQAAKLLENNTTLLREDLKTNFAIRIFSDLYSKQTDTNGFFVAFIKGTKWNKLIYFVDPQGISTVAPEQVMLVNYDAQNGGIWTAFPMSGSEGNIAEARTYDIKSHDLTVTIDGTSLKVSDNMTLSAMRDGVRVLPFELFPKLRVSKVSDAAGASIPFIQQDKDEDADFAVVLPAPLSRTADTTLKIDYAGDGALADSGGGNFTLVPRSTWYPNNGSAQFGDRSKFRVRYVVPKKFIVVGTGALAEPETTEGDLTVSTWTSGDLELAVAGFNYGRFKKKELNDPETGYNLEFYANKDVPDQIKELQHDLESNDPNGSQTGTTLGSISTTKMADTALGSAENATRIYNAYFGKLPYTRIAMSQQPFANFGQAWPTLVYMPFTAFIDTTQRAQLMGTRGGTDTFWRYVGPHEIAHQWWGHVVGWTSYRDQWMSEGFAEFSASLYVQTVEGNDKFIAFWEDHRKQIVTATNATGNKPPYTFGAVTQGFRLNAPKAGGVYRLLVYPKGAYILHMLRMLMYSPQTKDEAFIAMMKDFVTTYFNRDASTDDFKKIVEKHMTPAMNMNGDGKIDWFFDQWVYGSQVPAYAFEYSLADEGGKTMLIAKVTQSGVSDDFKMQVPVYLDFGKGWARLGQAPLVGNSSKEFKVALPQRPKRAAICALNDVLTTNITTTVK